MRSVETPTRIAMSMTFEQLKALTEDNARAIADLRRSIAEDRARGNEEQARRDKEQAKRDKQRQEEQAQRDKQREEEQAQRDKQREEEQARRDQEQAKRDKQRQEEQAQHDKQREEEQARRDQEQAKRDKQREEEQARRDQMLAEDRARWAAFMNTYGSYVDNQGRKVEEFFIKGLHKNNLKVGAIEFDDLFPGARRMNKRGSIEIDALLLNGSVVGVVEIKSTLHVNDVRKIGDSLIPRFRKLYPEHQDKQLAVIVAGESVNRDALKLARESGFIILQPDHEAISVDASHYQAW